MAEPKKAPPKFAHQQVMRSTYNDPQKLVSSLNDMYGEGNYRLKVKAPSNGDLDYLQACL